MTEVSEREATESAVTQRARKFSFYHEEASKERHSLFAELRSRCPVAHSDQDEPGEGFWMVSKYDDVVAAALNTDTFSSRYIMIPRSMTGDEYADRPPITADGSRHVAYRRALQPKFTTAQAASWDPVLREICKSSLAKIADKGVCDAHDDYAKKIPLEFVCKLFGMPPGVEEVFDPWLDKLVTSTDPDEMNEVMAEVTRFLSELIDERRANPTDDFVTTLVELEIAGQPLQGQELLSCLFVIMHAGLDTAAQVLTSSLWHLATHPEDRRRLVEDPSLMPTAVEELLRVYAPAGLSREANHDTEIAGVPIKKGELAYLAFPSANRDEDVFPDADKVVIDRAKNRHVAFGIGPHRCLGAAVARLELTVALSEWLKVIPEFALANPDEVQEYPPGFMWCISDVKLRIL